jgi:hypothetical protein
VGVENEVLLKVCECSEGKIRDIREKYVMRKSPISTQNGAKSRELKSLRHVACIRKTKICIPNVIIKPQGKRPCRRMIDLRQAAKRMEGLGP